jgi:hypothetical protein
MGAFNNKDMKKFEFDPTTNADDIAYVIKALSPLLIACLSIGGLFITNSEAVRIALVSIASSAVVKKTENDEHI